MSTIRCIFLLLAVVLLLSGCTAGRSAFNKAQTFEEEGNYDEAVFNYAEAIATNPQLSEYRLRFLKASEKGAEVHLKKGEQFLAQNRLDEAFREFQAASALDPSLEKAIQLAARTQRLRDGVMFRSEGESFEKERKLKDALRAYQRAVEQNPDDRLAKEGVQRLLSARKTKLDGYELSLKSQQPITLKFKEAKLKDVFAIVTQLSGINFIFDEGFKDQNVTIHLEKATFNQAIDVLTGMYRLGRKVLNESTIILYPKTPDKLKNYEDLVVRTFYLNRLDAKKAVNLLRTMLQLKKIYVNEDNNALVIRDTPETIEVAEKILEANDVPDAEVLLEVEIIELTKKNQEKFGLALSRYAVSAIFDHKNTFLSDTLTKEGTVGDGSITVPVPPANLLPFDLGSAHGFATVPNATFNFGKTLANGETLSNPKLRVKNREKAKFNVGTRQPITTTTTNGTATGYSVNVQYVDVGVKMNVEPVIQLNNEISMKLSLEVSSIVQKETIGGATSATTVVTIGTRNLDTVLSLKDGETTIIGGLIQDFKNNSKQKIMFLSDIPILGTLLTDRDDTNDKSELIMAITPRLIKGITLPDAGTERFWSGRDDEPSTSAPYISFAEEPQFETAPAAMPAKTSPAPAAKQAPEAAAVKPPPVTPAPPAVPAPPEAPPQGEATSASMTASLLWGLPGKVSTGDQFALSIVVDGVQGLHAVPLIIKFDPKLVEFVTARQGQFLGQDGHQVSFQAVPDIAAGTLSLTMSRPAGVAGVNGDGELVSIVFRARAKGLAQFDYRRAALADPAGRLFGVTSSDAWVEIE